MEVVRKLKFPNNSNEDSGGRPSESYEKDLTTPTGITAYLARQPSGLIRLDISEEYEKVTTTNAWPRFLLAIQLACKDTGKTVALDISQTTLATTGAFLTQETPPPIPIITYSTPPTTPASRVSYSSFCRRRPRR
jgi:hypothetical protein